MAGWPEGLGDMARLVRAHDWAATPLGPSEAWPQPLRTAIELMLASPMLATLAVGPERVFLYNDEALRHYGGRHPGVLGCPLAKAFAHEFDATAGYYDRVFGGESLHVPAQPLDPGESGTMELFDAYLSPLRDEGGQVIAAVMTGFAIGNRLSAETRLRNSEEQFRALVSASADVVYRMSPDWSEMRVLMGRGFLADTESPSGAWLGAYIAPDDQPRVIATIQTAIRDRTKFELEHRVRRADGSLGWTASRAVPLLNAEGEIREWLGTASDVTARKEAENSLRESEERFRTVADNISQLAWTCDRLGDVT